MDVLLHFFPDTFAGHYLYILICVISSDHDMNVDVCYILLHCYFRLQFNNLTAYLHCGPYNDLWIFKKIDP